MAKSIVFVTKIIQKVSSINIYGWSCNANIGSNVINILKGKVNFWTPCINTLQSVTHLLTEIKIFKLYTNHIINLITHFDKEFDNACLDASLVTIDQNLKLYTSEWYRLTPESGNCTKSY